MNNLLPYKEHFDQLEIGDYIVAENLLDNFVVMPMDAPSKGTLVQWKLFKRDDSGYFVGKGKSHMNMLFEKDKMAAFDINDNDEVENRDFSFNMPNGFHIKLYIKKKFKLRQWIKDRLNF